MPRYVFHNPTQTRIYIPGAGVWIGPQKNRIIEIQAVNLDNVHLNELVQKGALRMQETTESPRISDHIEIPVVDMITGGGGGGLSFEGDWSGLTAYQADDVVRYRNTSWVALVNNTGVTPTEGATWSALIPPDALKDVNRTNVVTTGAVDGVNLVFTTPEDFVHNPPSQIITVMRNGVVQEFGVHFGVSESGGVGTGFDTITFISPPTDNIPKTGDSVTVDYIVDD